MPDAAPVESVNAKVYRIAPADTPPGQEEFDEINRIRRDHGEQPFNSFQDLVDAIRDNGDTPKSVRANSSPVRSPEPHGRTRQM